MCQTNLKENLPVQLASSAANMQSLTPSQSQLPIVISVGLCKVNFSVRVFAISVDWLLCKHLCACVCVCVSVF